MGFFNSKGNKEGVWIEGRESKSHEHKDGTSGTDIYAAKVTYRDGEKQSEKDAGWGHIAQDEKTGEKKDHLK